MAYLKTKEAILRNQPELTDEDIDELNGLHTPYLFYTEHKNRGYRECWCSVCGEHFNYEYMQRTETREHYDFLSGRHNKDGKCPKCHAEINFKNTGKAKDCKNLDEGRRFCFFKKKSHNELYILCGYSFKSYFNYPYTHRPDYDISAVYYLTPGNVKMYKWNHYEGEWYEPKRIVEPFTKTYTYNFFGPYGYALLGYKDLKKSFLKYAPFEDFTRAFETNYRKRGYYYGYVIEEPTIKFLCYYTLYPSVEKLLKIDLGDFVCRLVDNMPMKRNINWSADKPHEVFKMNRAEFREFRENYYGMVDFQVFQTLVKVKPNIKYSTVAGYVDDFAGQSSVKVAEKIKQLNLNITHTFNYLYKNTKKDDRYSRENTAITWADYITFAKELNYDLTRLDVIFPKKLKEAHDNASAAVTVIQDKKKFEAYKSRYEKLQQIYEYSDGNYQIVVPMGVNDIIDEGRALGHCVGGYADRHMKGLLTILFLRKCDSPDTRFVTIEISGSGKNSVIMQKQGAKNRYEFTDEDKAFINKWIAWV